MVSGTQTSAPDDIACLGVLLSTVAAAFDRRDRVDEASVVRAMAHDSALLADWGVVAERIKVVRVGFNLSQLETAVLTWAMLPMLDPSYAMLYQRLNASAADRLTNGLLYELTGTGPVDPEIARAVSPSGGLWRHDLVLSTSSASDGVLSVARTIVRHLMGDQSPDDPVSRRLVDPVLYWGQLSVDVVAQLSAGVPVVHVVASDQHGGVPGAAAALTELFGSVVGVDLSRDADLELIDRVIRGALMHATLRQTPLLLDLGERPWPADVALIDRMARALVPVVVVSSEAVRRSPYDASVAEIRAPALTTDERVAMWRDLMVRAEILPDGHASDEWTSVLARYRVGPQSAAWIVSQAARSFTGASVPLTMLTTLAGRLSRDAQGHGASPNLTRLSDLAIAPEARETLEDALHRARLLLRDPGISLAESARGGRPGVTVLLTGPPGNGKTTTAHAIATELDVPLMAVQIATVVDKYIGETERKLEALFAAAETEPCVLFFDEADAIFGSRSAVNDAKDRFANQQVSYLLQRVEEYAGIVCLATNYAGNIDRAFTRRIDYIVSLREPDEPARLQIWKAQLEGSSVSRDHMDLLARTHQLTPAEILNAVSFAKVRAGRLGVELSPELLDMGIERELAKAAKRMTKAVL